MLYLNGVDQGRRPARARPGAAGALGERLAGSQPRVGRQAGGQHHVVELVGRTLALVPDRRPPPDPVDTSVIIELERIDARSLPREIAISAITLAELTAGPPLSLRFNRQPGAGGAVGCDVSDILRPLRASEVSVGNTAGACLPRLEGEIPQADGVVVTARRQRLAVGAESHARHGTVVPGQG